MLEILSHESCLYMYLYSCTCTCRGTCYTCTAVHSVNVPTHHVHVLYMYISLSVVPPLMERSYWSIPSGILMAHTVILRIVRAGCHPVAIAQVVEH